MINVKSITLITDGSQKRMAVTYDILSDEGKVVSSNKRINRILVDETASDAAETLMTYAEMLVGE